MSEEMYVVEKILKRRNNHKTGVIEYKIKWEGYSQAQCTWEPLYNLDYIADMVLEFNQQQQKNEGTPRKTHKIEKNRKGKQPRSRRLANQNQHNVQNAPNKYIKNASKEPKMQQSDQQPSSNSQNHPKDSVYKGLHCLKRPDQERKIIDASVIEASQSEIDDYSDLSDEVEVLQVMQDNHYNLYFQVRFPQEIKWISHRTMKKRFPLELIQFYQRQMQLAYNK